MQKKHTLILPTATLILLTACAFGGQAEPTPFPPPTEAPIEVPTAEPTPAPTATPEDMTILLGSKDTEIHDDEWMMDIFLSQPVMQKPESKADAFNQTIETLVLTEKSSFLGMVEENLEFQAENAQTFGYNSMYLEYYPTLTEHGIVSLHFTISNYIAGAAHPFSYASTLNYELETGRTLQMDNLFLPGSDYLGTISAQCIQIINETGYMDWPEGAEPIPENYLNWNITPDGILISFDPYQIAPYAVGPQQALVPYTALQPMIDPAGPLAPFLP